VINHLESNNSNAAVVRMDIIEENVIDNKINKISQYLHPDSGLGEISLYNQCNRNYLSNGIITYKRSLYNELGGYDESLPTAEDWDFGIRLMLKCDVDLIRSEEPLFYYHQRTSENTELANSVHGRVLEQEITINYLRNKYLRSDIHNGCVGVGYIMNASEADIVQTARIEGHINRVSQNTLDEVLRAEERIIKNSTYQKIKNKIKRK
jgi:hypothetical protein